MAALISVLAAGIVLGYLMGKGSGKSKALANLTGLKVILVGVDGAEWNILTPMMEAGRLPTFSRLAREGSSGKLRSLKPILSPIIWTSIATGKTPEKHGITWFMVKDPEHSRRMPVQSTMRRSKAVWNVLSDNGLTVGAIGWWASFPAERVNGFVISDYVAYHAFGLSGQDVKTSLGKTHPAALFDLVSSRLIDPLSIKREEVERFMPLTDQEWEFSVSQPFDFGNPLHHFMYALATAKAYRSVSLELYGDYDPAWMGVYFEQVDSLSHLFMKYTEPKMDGMSDEFFEKYKDVIENYYVYQDEILADFVKAADENTIIIVCSDHGFKTGDLRLAENEATSVAKAHLWHEMDGVVFLWGKPFKAGYEIEGASVLDITPTTLYAMGMPVARDMDGKPLLSAVKAEFRSAHPVAWIETYESETEPDADYSAPQDPGVDEEVAAKLEALGYIGSNVKDDEIKANLVKQLLDKGNYAKAGEEVEAVLARDPKTPWARVLKARLLERENKSREAEAIFREMARETEGQIEPADRVHYAESLQALAVYNHTRGDAEEAAKNLEKSIELFPQDPDTAYNLGVVREGQENYAAAIEAYQKAVDLSPSHFLALNNLGNCYRNVGEIQKSLAVYKKCIEANPKHLECHFNLGVYYINLGSPSEAVKELEEAKKIDADHLQTAIALTEAYMLNGETEKALASAADLSGGDPGNVGYLLLKAKALSLAGKKDEAAEAISEAGRLDPEGVKQAVEKDPALSSPATAGGTRPSGPNK